MTEELIVNCINLEHRVERKEQAIRQAKEQGFYIKFWEGIINRHDRREGVCKAHKQIVRDAKENGYKMVCIMEDDAIFFAAGAWDYFLQNMPEDFDLYLSMIYVGDINKENRITNIFSALTMYVVHERFYDFFLSLPDSCFVDRELGLTSHLHKYIVCDPFICYQDGSKSDNNLMTIVGGYWPWLEGRKLFGR